MSEDHNEQSLQIICVGDLCCDLIVPYGRMREALSKGDVSKQTADSLLVSMRCGGSVGNVARHLGRLQKQPVFVTPLKRDALGDYLASEMENAGADMRYAAPSQKSNMYCIAVIDENGERTMFSFVPSWADYPRFDKDSFASVPHFESEILFTSGMAILDDRENNTSVLDFFRGRRDEGALIVFDLNVRAESYGYEGERRSAMEEMISLSDIVLGSGEEEFLQVTGTADIREAAEILLNEMSCLSSVKCCSRDRSGAERYDTHYHSNKNPDRGILHKDRDIDRDNVSRMKAVVARDGGNPIYVLAGGGTGVYTSEGASAIRGADSGFFVPVKPVTPVSTLGAGDCFDARFLSAVSDGAGMADAVRLASDYAGEYISG